jgi:hypothetical protein
MKDASCGSSPPGTRNAAADLLVAQIASFGWSAVPLRLRVGYRYFDDHEWNEGSIGWLVVAEGELFGLDDDMRISISRFSSDALKGIAAQVQFDSGVAIAPESEREAARARISEG